jgi:hypothetical protein
VPNIAKRQLALALLLVLACGEPAAAIPVFAHRYGFSCQACHSEVPHLNAFGEAFLKNGYRVEGLAPRRTLPIAVRLEGAYASAGAADPDDARNGPLPRTIVNEIEVLSGGAIGPRGSYWVEQYLLDGGFPGRTRDAWVAYRATPGAARIPVTLRAGQFTLPLPLDPETFRETIAPYAIWSRNAGLNSFTFFDPKLGAQAAVGEPARALAVTASILQGREPQAYPAHGVDTMFTLERDLGAWSFSAYRYDGSRVLSGLGFGDTTPLSGIGDRFWRNGFGAGWRRGRTEANALYQSGNDTAADVYGDALASSGGFLQVRQALGERAFAIVRWDATQDSVFARVFTAGLGYSFAPNARLTVFGTHQRDFSGRPLTIISSSMLVAY